LSLGVFPEILAITSDQVKLLRRDNIVSPLAIAEGRTLQALGITPEPLKTLCQPTSTATARPGNSATRSNPTKS
jgi:hypothetical protein